MASGAPPPPPSPTVAVAVRPGGSASRRAARWAAASLLQDDGAGRAAAIAFVHVIPPLAFVPSPTGERVPVARVGRDAAKAYSHDRHARVQEALLPFHRLCGGRAYANVETVVVEGDDVAEALVRYAAESGVRSLVLGSVSFRWFQRFVLPFSLRMRGETLNFSLIPWRYQNLHVSSVSDSGAKLQECKEYLVCLESILEISRGDTKDQNIWHPCIILPRHGHIKKE